MKSPMCELELFLMEEDFKRKAFSFSKTSQGFKEQLFKILHFNTASVATASS